MSSDEILQAALSDAFDTSSTPPSRIAPKATVGSQATTEVPSNSDLSASTSSAATEEDWKDEYDGHVSRWREESARARDKAEKTRQQWEEVRANESKMSASWDTIASKSAVPETDSRGFASGGSPSPADVRDLVAGEPSKESSLHSRQDTGEDSKWENVSSQTTSAASFPSLAFPEPSQSPRTTAPLTHEVPKQPLISATTAIFDGTLSTRTRAAAVFSALAINFLLPFVNGVMLGFGEIFAKNVVVHYFGWKPLVPGTTPRTASVAASKGIGIASAKQ
ncbi:hypothetical protein DL96DRAFT_1587034 [Flagelloscypha sp. PMI_526]|nr:hypothetical protein DL96DRAFT_1587034 [Flagelloscypha sp. PMI_526]